MEGSNADKARIVLRGVVSFACITLVWWAVAASGFIESFFLPEPVSLLRGLYTLFTEHGFLWDIVVSIWRVAAGFAIAVVLALPIGILIGLSRKAEAFIEPVVDFIRYTPTPALIPLFILWFGIGETEKIVVIAQSVFFQLVLMTANSVSSVPKELVESARTLGATRRQVILHVVVPYARPRIYDDLRICIGWAWSALMAAEIVGASSGIGLAIIQAQRLLRTDLVMAAVLAVGLIGLFTDILLKQLYPVLFPWAPRLRNHA